ncbi:alcohol dehydrogenase catalytic domain-containing protein [Pseudanabaena sp. FACHB-1998]|nr:alcohol dehydrogenase catalytic domain-containing protein [Pseudanabaena sp. FACHB-1998]
MKGMFLSADWDPKEGYELAEYELTTKKALYSNNVWRNPKLELKELEVPSPNSNEVLVKVRACGICGSDLHYVEHDEQGYILYPGHAKLNIVIGHEFSGEVVEVGSGVEDLVVGDLVTVEEMYWCGKCISCKNGHPNQCERLEELGVTINGGMAEYVAVPAKLCWKINEFRNLISDDQKLFDIGALVEPTSVAYNAIYKRAQGFKPGATAAVFGGGPIGLLATALLKVGGASQIIVVEPQEERRKIAKLMGADICIDPTSIEKDYISVSRLLIEITKGYGVDVLVDAAGVPGVLTEIMRSMAVAAKIIPVAISGDTYSINFTSFQAKAGHIFGSMGHSGSGNFQNVIRLISSGRLNIEPMIGKKFPIEQGLEAFKIAMRRSASKVFINF